VQAEPLDVTGELAAFARGRTDVGGIASFVGLVRDEHAGEPVLAMTLEHYPGMTERELARIEAEAQARWPLIDSLIVHRVGRMLPGEAIVLVATASAHRAAALDACAFLIDWLKTKAPFWKLEETPGGERWVAARAADDAAAARWEPGSGAIGQAAVGPARASS
jgi:molybdopterin synthase catalytic subunit